MTRSQMYQVRHAQLAEQERHAGRTGPHAPAAAAPGAAGGRLLPEAHALRIVDGERQRWQAGAMQRARGDGSKQAGGAGQGHELHGGCKGQGQKKVGQPKGQRLTGAGADGGVLTLAGTCAWRCALQACGHTTAANVPGMHDRQKKAQPPSATKTQKQTPHKQMQRMKLCCPP